MDATLSPGIRVRPAVWPDDLEAVAGLDTSYESGQIYEVVRGNLAFAVREAAVSPPIRKRYPWHPEREEERCAWSLAVVAEVEEGIVGFAAAEHAEWNRRVVLWHLYVAPHARGNGVGTRLLAEVERFAQAVRARCVWVETQNTNAPAVRFYRHAGFQFCGLDESLYDPRSNPDEVGLFFWKPLS